MHCIKGDYDLFDSLEEFIDNIKRGGEIEFEFNNKKHSITQPEGELNYIEFENMNSLSVFNNINELLEFEIDGERIKDIATKIKPFFRTF
jgi:hypothetical protein